MEIYWRCTGVLPVMFLVGLVAATPAPRSRRIVGAVTGSAVIVAGNLLRLAVLFDIGVRQPALFATAHEVGGEIFIVLLVFASWRIWMHWAERGLTSREAMAT
jgi:exosortase/archaeosortase family protein